MCLWSLGSGEFVEQKAERPALESRGPPGGLLGIDQEVVTLRGPFGKLRVPTPLAAGGSTLITGSRGRVLRATALSLSHLTWSFTATTIRTCHQTTSFPV